MRIDEGQAPTAKPANGKDAVAAAQLVQRKIDTERFFDLVPFAGALAPSGRSVPNTLPMMRNLVAWTMPPDRDQNPLTGAHVHVLFLAQGLWEARRTRAGYEMRLRRSSSSKKASANTCASCELVCLLVC